MRKGHTIIELLVAMGLLVAIMAGSGVVFQGAMESHRTAIATSEVTQKLRAITEQLDADFGGLQKDGEVVCIWAAYPVRDEYGVIVDTDGDGSADEYERFDRLMFFADGDFQTYNPQPLYVDNDYSKPPVGNKTVRGNLARVSYMLAKNGDGQSAGLRESGKRILARNQHIYTAIDPLYTTPQLAVFPDLTDPDPLNFDEQAFRDGNYSLEYDTTTMLQWLNMDWVIKEKVLSIIGDVTVNSGTTLADSERGVWVEKDDPSTLQMLFCDGLGSFSVQFWYEPEQRWIPEVDPDGDGDLTDTDFIPGGSATELHATDLPGFIYPAGWVGLNPNKYAWDEIKFDFGASGFGKALKFTFTLYDSAGVFADGKTFSHIVYLAN